MPRFFSKLLGKKDDQPKCTVCGNYLWGRDQTDFKLCGDHLPGKLASHQDLWGRTNRNDVDYYRYLASPEWRAKANAAKERARWRCQICGRPGNNKTLNAHHRTYDRLGCEWDEDITVLCGNCHKNAHASGIVLD